MSPYGVAELPENYQEILNIDLQKNKKLALIVNGIALVITVVLLAVGIVCGPKFNLFDVDDNMTLYFVRLGLLLFGMVFYIITHEVIHGIFMKLYSGQKVKYGFTGMYAFAGSDAYFNKSAYIIIALAPVVIWGVILAAACCIVPASWFWVVYFIQIINLSGAGGDFYVTWKFSKLPKDILVCDSGVSMIVYSQETAQ